MSPTDLGFALVFFIYGLALFSLGLAVALEARRSTAATLVPSLKYLAVFGFLQTAVAWLNASFTLDRSLAPPDQIPPIRVFAVILMACAALSLILFGTQLLVRLRPAYDWLLPFPWILFGAWLVSLVVPHVGPVSEAARPTGTLCLECHPGQPLAFIKASGNWLTSADVWARYLLYFPGAVLAALAFLAQRPRFLQGGLVRIAHYCVVAAAAFALDALITGLVVPPAPYFPASHLNFATFSRLFGLPPQILSAAIAIAVACAVVQILNVFEIERGQQLVRANEARFAAQQELLETQRRAQEEMAEWNRQLEARVLERTRELEALNAQLKDVTILEERDRIARELHDSLAQVLGYLSLRASVLAGHLSDGRFDAMRPELEHIQRVADDAYADVREAILGLRTKTTSHDLVPTLAEYLRKFSLQTGIQAALTVAPGADVRFPPTVEIQLVRVIQEALTNVRKHAGAEHAWVRFRIEDGRTVVVVEDDGRGFDVDGVDDAAHFGLSTMRERVQIVGGKLDVSSEPGRGTRVTVILSRGPAGVVEEPTGGTA